MVSKKLLALAIAAGIPATSALADTSMINCPGYIIAISDDLAIEGQARAGNLAAFERLVCERSSNLSANTDSATTIPVYVEELGITTRVIIFPED
ncbi:MAG: hypothetical protein AAFR35_13905 [Pseudomonadota bacterium]